MARDAIVIAAPLEYERTALDRAGFANRASLSCCGPGADAVTAWCRMQTAREDDLVILAGLAGSLDERYPSATAHLVGAVVDADGHRHVPTLAGVDGDPTLLAVPAVLASPQDKRAWARRSGAQLVDLESFAFAQAATARGWRWAIVRGVSDGPHDHLPRGADTWVDGHGRTRPAKVLTSLLRSPGALPGTLRLAGRSRRAMHAVAEVLERILANTGG